MCAGSSPVRGSPAIVSNALNSAFGTVMTVMTVIEVP